jgi:hypothetical protein
MADLTPDVAHYGDVNKLKQMSTGVKKTGGTYGATVQRNPVGRPQGDNSAAVAPATSPQGTPIPEEQVSAMQVFANAEKTAQDWLLAAQRPDAGPFVRAYAEQARQVANKLALQLKTQTPNF